MRVLIRVATTIYLAIAAARAGLWLLVAAQGLVWRADYTSFYTGWSLILAGRSAELYDLRAQAEVQYTLTGGQIPAGGVLPYLNPPHTSLPLVWLAWPPLPWSYALWAAFQLALLAWCLRLIWQAGEQWPREVRWLTLAAVLALPSLSATLVLGNLSLLLLLCWLQATTALRTGSARRAGVWLALTTIKPQLALGPGVLLLAARRWRAIGAAAVVVLALALPTLLIPGWQSWGQYLRMLAEYSRGGGSYGVAPAAMWNLRGVLAWIPGVAGTSAATLASYVALAAALLAIAWLWRRGWQATPAPMLRLAISLLLTLLSSPHLYAHDGLLLVVPALLFASHLHAAGRPVAPCTAAACASPAILLLPELLDLPGTNLLAVLLMTAWLGWMLWMLRSGGPA